MIKARTNRKYRRMSVIALAVAGTFVGQAAHAYKFDTDPDWAVTLDNSLQYTMGWRVEGPDDRVANDPARHQSELAFDKGEMITNRLQDLIEFQAVYQGRMGVRLSGSVWKDWAYDDEATGNPAILAAQGNVYGPSGKYRSDAKRFHIQGAELLDAFAFLNTEIAGVPLYLKAGRLTQYWGNSFYFGYSNIGYSQAAIDNIKGFSQPGSEVKELFLPRAQLLATAELTPELSVSGQYFFEFDGNRYPEGGTYFGAADFVYNAPVQFGGLAAGKEYKAKNNNDNFGVKLTWSPEWAQGDLGFYYRQFDEVHPWTMLDANAGGPGRLGFASRYADNVKLFGFSYERVFGPASTGLEISYRKDTALQSGVGSGVETKGATGDLVSVVANAFVQLGTTPFYDAGTFIAELAYTHLVDVTGNKHLYLGKGDAACGFGGVDEGCATKNALALWVSFEPQWLQVAPSWDVSMPMSYAWGASGNPAYAAGGFYAKDTGIFSIGVKGTYKGKTSVALAYNGLNWNPGEVVNGPYGEMYAGGNGAYGLHKRDWVSLTVKSSF